MDRVRFGIIGAGHITRHVSWVFGEDESLVVTAITDDDTSAAEALAADFKTKPAIHEDYRRLIESPDVDAVYVTMPPYQHRSIVLNAIAAGKHVLCEKPFMLNVDDARSVLAAAAQKPELRVGCCTCRFHASGVARKARELIAAGDLGQIYRIHFEAITRPAPPGASLPAWRNNPKQTGGGIAFDWGVYDLDWMSFLVSDAIRPRSLFSTLDTYFALTPERVPPAPDVDGRLAAEIRCEDGLTIHWERRAGEHGPERHRVEILGKKASLLLGMVPSQEELHLVRHSYEGSGGLTTRTIPVDPTDWGETLVYPIRDLAAAIREGRDPASPPRRQLFIHTVLKALYASARTGTSAPVKI